MMDSRRAASDIRRWRKFWTQRYPALALRSLRADALPSEGVKEEAPRWRRTSEGDTQPTGRHEPAAVERWPHWNLMGYDRYLSPAGDAL